MSRITGLFLFVLMMFTTPGFTQVEPEVEQAIRGSVKLIIPKVSSGSGFAVEYDRKRKVTIIVTNDHVCQATRGKDKQGEPLYDSNLNSVAIFARSTMNSRIEARVAYVSNMHKPSLMTKDDLCIVEAKAELPLVSFSKRNYAQLGEKVFSVSAPRGFFPIVHDGRAGPLYSRSSKYTEVQAFNLTVNTGSSGGAVFDLAGKVVGVIFAMNLAENNIRVPVVAYVIPGYLAREFFERYKKRLKSKK